MLMLRMNVQTKQPINAFSDSWTCRPSCTCVVWAPLGVSHSIIACFCCAFISFYVLSLLYCRFLCVLYLIELPLYQFLFSIFSWWFCSALWFFKTGFRCHPVFYCRWFIMKWRHSIYPDVESFFSLFNFHLDNLHNLYHSYNIIPFDMKHWMSETITTNKQLCFSSFL